MEVCPVSWHWNAVATLTMGTLCFGHKSRYMGVRCILDLYIVILYNSRQQQWYLHVSLTRSDHMLSMWVHVMLPPCVLAQLCVWLI